MKKWMYARLTWLTKEEGGRTLPVPVTHEENIDNRYCPIVEFQDENMKNRNWSAAIYVITQIDEYHSMIKISYLSENAPFELLKEGAEFKLYEGNKLVATGILRDEMTIC